MAIDEVNRREYDATSRAASSDYRSNYDRVFGKGARPVSADGRHATSPSCALSGCDICRLALAGR